MMVENAELSALIEQVSKNGVTLRDHHAVLKIVLTLPILEKYQTEHKPSPNALKEVLIEQSKMIEHTDSLTPNF